MRNSVARDADGPEEHLLCREDRSLTRGAGPGRDGRSRWRDIRRARRHQGAQPTAPCLRLERRRALSASFRMRASSFTTDPSGGFTSRVSALKENVQFLTVTQGSERPARTRVHQRARGRGRGGGRRRGQRECSFFIMRCATLSKRGFPWCSGCASFAGRAAPRQGA